MYHDQWQTSGKGHGNPLQYSCLENPQEQRSLAGYNPQVLQELDIDTQLIHVVQQQLTLHRKAIILPLKI